MKRLNREIFDCKNNKLNLPSYSSEQCKENTIVHLGVGAFHRAHQALYTDKVAQLGERWSIIGASLRSDSVQKQLAPQDFLYTVVERKNETQTYQVVQSIQNIIVAPQQPQALLDAMAHHSCNIISLTITEKGYCHNPATGKLDNQHPDIQHDLKHLSQPRSAPGFMVQALKMRFENNLPGVAILSCDNLPNNGQLTRNIILDLANLVDTKLAHWIDKNVSFPSSMVDRIVPATQESDRAQLSSDVQYQDDAMVVCEPFSMWVIEDNFIQGRPAWEKAGATFVQDVHDFENMKLRLLNGSHSAMAYLGFLSGYPYVSQVMEDTNMVAFIQHLMDNEITPTLIAPPQIDLSQYKQQLLARFSNRALKHPTAQIAMDGSQKLPQRILRPIEDQLENSSNIDGLCLVVAAWIRYSQGVDEEGVRYDINDPIAQHFAQIYTEHTGNTQAERNSMVDAMLALTDIFPKDLAHNLAFSGKVKEYVRQLVALGAKETVAEFLKHHN